jgi:hypothetical protein
MQVEFQVLYVILHVRNEAVGAVRIYLREIVRSVLPMPFKWCSRPPYMEDKQYRSS